MVVLYSWSGVRDIPWSRVRVRVLAHCRVMVLVFAVTIKLLTSTQRQAKTLQTPKP